MPETVNHSALTTHSVPFSLGGGVYSMNVFGTITHGTDAIEFQRLQNGGFASVDPPIRFLNNDNGGTKLSGLLPAGIYRWTIPGNRHNINTSVVKG
jgi:hypothetical protein